MAIADILARHLAIGANIARSRYSSADREKLNVYQDQLNAYQSQVDAYNKDIETYNTGLTDWKKDYDPWREKALAEDPNVEIPALQERLQNQQQQQPVLRTPNQRGALNPPTQTPTLSSGPALSPVQQQPAAVQTASQGSGPVDRAKFAALFPEARELLGIGSLMGQV